MGDGADERGLVLQVFVLVQLVSWCVGVVRGVRACVLCCVVRCCFSGFCSCAGVTGGV